MLNLSGKRLSVNRCKVQCCGGRQFMVTIPRGVALRMGLEKGDVLFFEYWREGQFRVFKEDGDDKE